MKNGTESIAERSNLLTGEQLSHGAGSTGHQGGNRHAVSRLIILHYSPFKAVWDWITLLLVLYTAVCTPYTAAFLLEDKDAPLKASLNASIYASTVSPSSGNVTSSSVSSAGGQTRSLSDILSIIDVFVDIMFIADILINFRTSYLHNGEVVVDPKKIALNYMKSWFLIDSAAAIPFDLLLYGTGTSDVSLIYLMPSYNSPAGLQ